MIEQFLNRVSRHHVFAEPAKTCHSLLMVVGEKPSGGTSQ